MKMKDLPTVETSEQALAHADLILDLEDVTDAERHPFVSGYLNGFASFYALLEVNGWVKDIPPGALKDVYRHLQERQARWGERGWL